MTFALSIALLRNRLIEFILVSNSICSDFKSKVPAFSKFFFSFTDEKYGNSEDVTHLLIENHSNNCISSLLTIYLQCHTDGRGGALVMRSRLGQNN